MRYLCFLFVCVVLSSCAHLAASGKGMESSCTWKNPTANNCATWKMSVPMPRPVTAVDLGPFNGGFPAVELVYNPKSDSNEVEIAVLDPRCLECGDKRRVTMGAMVLCGKYPMVLTAKHAIGISQFDFDLFPQDALLMRFGFSYDPADSVYEISDLTTAELEHKTAQMFFRLGDSLYVMDLTIMVSDWLAGGKRFLIPVPTDLGEYFGGVSGTPLFYKGKVIGIFSGFITARAEFSLASFSTPETLRDMLEEATKSPSKIVIR